MFLDAETPEEAANRLEVARHMDALVRVPTIVAAAVMPDACPSGRDLGTIPVGGVVATENAIHPGFHSADICCSMAVTVFDRRADLGTVLDGVQAVTHFGPGARRDPIEPPVELMRRISENPFLRGLEAPARLGFATQGDGNHFAFVGTLASADRPALVTHHGSRSLGALLYKRGMAVARKHTAIHARRVPAHSAWIDAESVDGRAYWEALQIVRAWTKASHFAIHELAAQRLGLPVAGRFWNEHNFVFRKADGLYYHGKGATPSWDGFSADDDGVGMTLIPLNMAEPVLVARHRDRREALGFAPHGAGRNASRTAFLKAHAGLTADDLVARYAPGIEVRSYCGTLDASELPGAYKNAASVRAQIAKYDLAEIVDEIRPYGSIMAGDWQWHAPWRGNRRAETAEEGSREERDAAAIGAED